MIKYTGKHSLNLFGRKNYEKEFVNYSVSFNGSFCFFVNAVFGVGRGADCCYHL